MITFDTHPQAYRHWKLTFDGPIATLSMDVREDAGLSDDYKLKLKSSDLGVDIELADAIQRIRFEHPEVRAVIVNSLKERIFCAGANIMMLRESSHGWKVNFCKFTNETRLAMEDASRHSGIRFLAALNGICAGGGYELALACDEIILVDDGHSAVSLPEAPLLGVLPGTGGLTRVVDKRHVRRDLALFSALALKVAIAVDNARLYDDLRSLFYNTVETLVRTIQAKDQYTAGHSTRESRYSLMIADKLGMSTKEKHQLYLAAMLHDIGKIGVPDDLLNRPGKLSDAEMERVSR